LREDAASRSWSEVAFSVVLCLRLKMDWAGGDRIIVAGCKVRTGLSRLGTGNAADCYACRNICGAVAVQLTVKGEGEGEAWAILQRT